MYFFYPEEQKPNFMQSQNLILDDRNLSLVSHMTLLSLLCMTYFHLHCVSSQGPISGNAVLVKF